MKSKDEILLSTDVGILMDGDMYTKYGITIDKIKLAMQQYASQEVEKAKDELIEKIMDKFINPPPKMNLHYEMWGKYSVDMKTWLKSLK